MSMEKGDNSKTNGATSTKWHGAAKEKSMANEKLGDNDKSVAKERLGGNVKSGTNVMTSTPRIQKKSGMATYAEKQFVPIEKSGSKEVTNADKRFGPIEKSGTQVNTREAYARSLQKDSEGTIPGDTHSSITDRGKSECDGNEGKNKGKVVAERTPQLANDKQRTISCDTPSPTAEQGKSECQGDEGKNKGKILVRLDVGKVSRKVELEISSSDALEGDPVAQVDLGENEDHFEDESEELEENMGLEALFKEDKKKSKGKKKGRSRHK